MAAVTVPVGSAGTVAGVERPDFHLPHAENVTAPFCQ